MYHDIKIGVVVPSYGRVTTLWRVLKSVLNQTHKNYEIVIMDDNAKAKMAEEIDAISSSFGDSRIRVIHNKTNIGGALARNVGIESSMGEYITFLDDDDEFLSEKLEKQLTLILGSEDKKLAMTYCWDKALDSKGKVLYTY